MKKKVMCMLLTGMMAAGVLAGCGNGGTADTTGNAGTANAGTVNAGDAAADTADSAEGSDAAADNSAEGSDAATGDFDAGEYINVTSREDGSGTRGAFIELFGIEEKDESGEKVDYTTEEANITNSTDVMMTTVAGDEYAIGYISLGSLNDTVKAVSIDGAEATVENIKSGTYTIARPFNIATKGEISEAAQDFVNFILSAEGQTVISDNGYITVDDAAEAFASNSAEGKVVVATTGMTNALEGTCDIGMASRELKDSETEGGLTGTVIAMDGIAVVINNGNPTSDLSKDDVNGIFRGEITTWDEIAK